MKRSLRIVLFIAVTAATFGSLNHFTGSRHCGPGFRNRPGCGMDMQAPQPTPPGHTPVTTI